MAKSYVKFKTPESLIEKIKQAVSVAKQTGRVRKGINEVTKCIEAGKPSLVVIAEDVDPEEIVLHIPMICEERGVYYCYLPTRKDVGDAAGLGVPCSCVAIEQDGQAAEHVRDVKEGIEPVFPKKKVEEKAAEHPKKEEHAHAAAKPAQEGEKPKKERKPKAPKKEAEAPAPAEKKE